MLNENTRTTRRKIYLFNTSMVKNPLNQIFIYCDLKQCNRILLLLTTLYNRWATNPPYRIDKAFSIKQLIMARQHAKSSHDRINRILTTKPDTTKRIGDYPRVLSRPAITQFPRTSKTGIVLGGASRPFFHSHKLIKRSSQGRCDKKRPSVPA